jgi:hypothetical protein
VLPDFARHQRNLAVGVCSSAGFTLFDNRGIALKQGSFINSSIT